MEQTHNEQVIIQYLLGALSNEETERLDKLSFTDDEFAAALRASENDLVDAYVQGDLTGATLEQFRANYLSSASRRERVQFAEGFQTFASKHASAYAAEGLPEFPAQSEGKRRRQAWFPVSRFITVRRPVLQWGSLAAVLALLLVGGWLLVDNIRLRRQLSQAQPSRDALLRREEELRRELEQQRSVSSKAEQELARLRTESQGLEQEPKQPESKEQRVAEDRTRTSIASFVLTPQMRGLGQVPVLSIPSAANHVELQLELEPGDYLSYRVTLQDQSSSQTLWRSGILKAKATGHGKALTARLRTRLLRPQMYLIQVSGISEEGTPEVLADYPFRVVRQEQ